MELNTDGAVMCLGGLRKKNNTPNLLLYLIHFELIFVFILMIVFSIINRSGSDNVTHL